MFLGFNGFDVVVGPLAGTKSDSGKGIEVLPSQSWCVSFLFSAFLILSPHRADKDRAKEIEKARLQRAMKRADTVEKVCYYTACEKAY